MSFVFVLASHVTFPSQPIQGCVFAHVHGLQRPPQIGGTSPVTGGRSLPGAKVNEKKGQKSKWLCLRCDGKNARSRNECHVCGLEWWRGRVKDKEKGTDKDEVELDDSD